MVTYADLLNARDTINKLATTPLPTKVGLKLATSIREVFLALERLDRDRQRLLKKYVDIDKDGEPMTDKKGEYRWLDKDGFSEEMQEVVDQDAQVEYRPLNAGQIPKSAEFTPLESLQLADAGLIKE